MTTEAVGRAPAGAAGFRLLAEHLPNLVLLAFDHELRIWAATGAALQARGWTPGDFVGKRVPSVGRPADAAVVEAYCLAALDGECRRLETTGNKDPSRLWAQLFVPLPDERGAMVGGMLIAMRDLAQVLHPADLERVAAQVERMRLDPAGFAFEHRIVRADGAVRSVLARGEGMADEDGRVVRFIGTDQDVTERRRADAERRRLLGRVYEAQEGQDRRLTADLHDGHVQSLAAIGFKLQQALANVVDHAQATRALVAIECAEAGVVLRVSDDGRGFDPDHVQVLADIAHFDLIAMRERVEALGGRFRVTTAPGQGTVVGTRLPLTDPAEWRWGA